MTTTKSIQQSMPANVNELATLAMMASTAADERPSGETAEAHATRIFAGLTQQLGDKTLATAGKWSLVWLARSPGNENLVFVAQNPQENAIVVSFRGTLFSVLGDLMEDLGVGTVVGLEVSVNQKPRTVGVSTGSMTAFTQVMNAVSLPATSPQYPNSNLMTVLRALVQAATSPLVIHVVGHSLGGAIASVVGLYLQGQTWTGAHQPSFRVCTFAAPTAGVQSFADAYKDAFTGANSAAQIVNTYDVVPKAWNSLADVASWYPEPGPSAKKAGTDILYTMIAPGLLNGQTYVHPCEQIPCNVKDHEPYYHYNQYFTQSNSQDWNLQTGYQHLSYLELLKAPALLPGPSVTAIDVTSGPTSGGTTVTISGSNFTSDCTVDFGSVAAHKVVFVSSSTLTATSPPGWGVANVTVTNSLGTSSVAPPFAFGGPEPIVVALSSPESGKHKTEVTIQGSGLKQVDTVVFSFPSWTTPVVLKGTDLVIVNDNEIQVKVPPRPINSNAPPVNVSVGVKSGDLYTPAGSFDYTTDF